MWTHEQTPPPQKHPDATFDRFQLTTNYPSTFKTISIYYYMNSQLFPLSLPLGWPNMSFTWSTLSYVSCKSYDNAAVRTLMNSLYMPPQVQSAALGDLASRYCRLKSMGDMIVLQVQTTNKGKISEESEPESYPVSCRIVYPHTASTVKYT